MPSWLIPGLAAGGSFVYDRFFGGNDPETTTTTNENTYNLDPGSRGYIDRMRGHALGSASGIMNHPGQFMLGPDQRSIGEQASEFFNPYQQNVIDSVRGQYNYQRGLAGIASDEAATRAGAFGGSRAAVERGSRLGAIDRAESSTIANLMHSGYQNAVTQSLQHNEYRRALRERQAQEPIWRAQQAQGLMQGGYGGPTGYTNTGTSTTTAPRSGSPFGRALGAGMTVYGGLASLGGGLPQRPAPIPAPTVNVPMQQFWGP